MWRGLSQDFSFVHQSWRIVVPISKTVLWPVVGLVVLITGAVAFGVFRHDSGTPQSSDDKVIYLDQAWSQADREMYYSNTARFSHRCRTTSS